MIEDSSFFTTPRFFSLLAFVVQHALLTIGLRFSATHGDPSDVAITSTEVFLTELAKLLLSILISFTVDAKGSVRNLFVLLEKAFVDEGMDLVKLGVPAVLYTIQNNLQYVIDQAPLFLVMYQTKILTTAFFFSYMLARRLSLRDWMTITALALGVGMVQSSQTDVHLYHASNVVGLLCVLLACLTSGFAGIYFEKTIKASKTSIWLINVELSLLSTAMGRFACLAEDTEEIARRGFFHGYNSWVVLVIFLQAGAGLVVALVVKYSDNINKGFAAGISTIMSSFLDYLLWNDTATTKTFFVGAFLVLVSTFFFAHSNLGGGGLSKDGALIVSSSLGGAADDERSDSKISIAVGAHQEGQPITAHGATNNRVHSPAANRWAQRFSMS